MSIFSSQVPLDLNLSRLDRRNPFDVESCLSDERFDILDESFLGRRRGGGRGGREGRSESEGDLVSEVRDGEVVELRRRRRGCREGFEDGGDVGDARGAV